MSEVCRRPPLHGPELLATPILNKGTAFTEKERTALGLHGLLPPYIETLEEQVARAYAAYAEYGNELRRHINLRALQDNNEVLFYRLLLDHIEEMMPVVYTPVVALACRYFSRIYRRPRGLLVSYPLRDRIPELLRSRPYEDVDVIVVTDGERVLGIGDQGVGGLSIPVGKLSLYTLIGGIHPARTLPIVLDVGCNNEELLRAPEYLGWRHERIRGDTYFEFVDRFVRAVKQELPYACLQWEDFATPHARPILERYRHNSLTFNDDIQGTAAVALGAIIAAVRATGRRLRDQRVVFLGAGSASIGVADYLRGAMEDDGLSEREALSRFWIIDKDGLLHSGRTDLSPEQRLYAQPLERVPGIRSLTDVIANVDATVADAAAELVRLPGIGISRASKILALANQREFGIYDSRSAHGMSDLCDASRRLIAIPPGRVIRGDHKTKPKRESVRAIRKIYVRSCASSATKPNRMLRCASTSPGLLTLKLRCSHEAGRGKSQLRLL